MRLLGLLTFGSFTRGTRSGAASIELQDEWKTKPAKNTHMEQFGNNEELKTMPGHTIEEAYAVPLPYTYVSSDDLPEEFSWSNYGGVSYLSKSLNQHIPVYCGSCWAHAAASVLADRINIAAAGVSPATALISKPTQQQLRRSTENEVQHASTKQSCHNSNHDINLSIQFVLNCGGKIAGSCHGGQCTGMFDFIKHHIGYIPYDTCSGYMACSSDSEEEFCKHVDTSCSPSNICRNCANPAHKGTGHCWQVDSFPNATIAEYGHYKNHHKNRTLEEMVHVIKAEIFSRGPVTAGIASGPIHNYTGGIVRDDPSLRNLETGHAVSIIGWGVEALNEQSSDDSEAFEKRKHRDKVHYWIVRNSWGQYWGEMGFFRIEMGTNLLSIESGVAWATPSSYSVYDPTFCKHNKGCTRTEDYMDPGEVLSVVAQ